MWISIIFLPHARWHRADGGARLAGSTADAGQRPGTTTSNTKRIKDLERENQELKRANEILLAASSFFARELDPRLPW